MELLADQPVAGGEQRVVRLLGAEEQDVLQRPGQSRVEQPVGQLALWLGGQPPVWLQA